MDKMRCILPVEMLQLNLTTPSTWKTEMTKLTIQQYLPAVFHAPIAFGMRYDRIKNIDTPLYKENTTQNFESYNQMLLLKVSFRFERGGSKSVESTSNRYDERER